MKRRKINKGSAQKVCTKCGVALTAANWQPSFMRIGKYVCKKHRRERRATSIGRFRERLRAIRTRAKEKGLAFGITLEDLLPLPVKCPLLGVTMEYDKGERSGAFRGNRPSVDRIDNSKGYVKGNVWVISNRANILKRDATLDEMKRLVAAWEVFT